MRATLALLFSLIGLVANATTLPQLTIEELYSKADVVAVVEIKSGAINLRGQNPFPNYLLNFWSLWQPASQVDISSYNLSENYLRKENDK